MNDEMMQLAEECVQGVRIEGRVDSLEQKFEKVEHNQCTFEDKLHNEIVLLNQQLVTYGDRFNQQLTNFTEQYTKRLTDIDIKYTENMLLRLPPWVSIIIALLSGACGVLLGLAL